MPTTTTTTTAPRRKKGAPPRWTARFTTQFAPEQLEGARRLADLNGTTVAQELRAALDDRLADAGITDAA